MSINVIDFFQEHITDIHEQLYSARFEITEEEVNQWQQDMEDYYHERAMSRLSIDEDEY